MGLQCCFIGMAGRVETAAQWAGWKGCSAISIRRLVGVGPPHWDGWYGCNAALVGWVVEVWCFLGRLASGGLWGCLVGVVLAHLDGRWGCSVASLGWLAIGGV